MKRVKLHCPFQICDKENSAVAELMVQAMLSLLLQGECHISHHVSLHSLPVFGSSFVNVLTLKSNREQKTKTSVTTLNAK